MAVYCTGAIGNSVESAIAILVTVTGTGNANYCYATINGTKYSSATSSIEVFPDDIITFGVYGSYVEGKLVVNGETLLTVSNMRTKTYDWTVPSGITNISIKLAFSSDSSYTGYATITVTTS